ncbi:MAG: DegV family protein [Clostridia bacterium]|nr:DegV family protein [Clostridia bacterium]
MSEKPFILSCESTVDLPYAELQARGISVIFYSYTVDGKEYEDDMSRDPEAMPRFYRMLADGKLPKTSQIGKEQYREYLEALLQEGDVLHIAFGSGMTPSVNNAMAAAEELRLQYPDRKIAVLDSL